MPSEDLPQEGRETAAALAARADPAVPLRRRRPGRAGLLLLAIALLLALLLLSTMQNWLRFEFATGAAAQPELLLSGQQLSRAPLLSVLAGFAALLGFFIAGKVFRRIIAVLLGGLGVLVGFIALRVLNAPYEMATAQLAKLIGVSGAEQLRFVTFFRFSPWPGITIGFAALLLICALLLLIDGGQIRIYGRKYAAGSPLRVRATPVRAAALAAGTAAVDRIADWDAISAGDDPSQR